MKQQSDQQVKSIEVLSKETRLKQVLSYVPDSTLIDSLKKEKDGTLCPLRITIVNNTTKDFVIDKIHDIRGTPSETFTSL